MLYKNQLLYFWICGRNPTVQPNKQKLLIFPVVLFIILCEVVLTFTSVDKIFWCDHSNESYWAALNGGALYWAVQSDPNFWVCGLDPKF